jgi:hypothetical protein
MSLSDNEVSDGKQGNSESPQSGNILFLGDVGELAFETRRVLVQLLAGPSLDGRRHPKLWPILQRDEPVIRRRLADLFLELVVDRDLQVAFTKQADGGELEIPILLRRLQLTFLDSVLLLFLRQRLAQADAQGERAVIASEEVEEYLSLYEHTTNTDKAGFRKRIQGSMEKIKQNSILQKLRSGDDRFEISPTLKLLFSADEIQALAKLYERMSTTTSEHHTTESSELESDDKVDQ